MVVVRRTIFVRALLLLPLWFSWHAFGKEDAVQRYRNYTPKEISSLPEEERRTNVPLMFTFAAQRGMSIGSELLFGMELNSLMYSGLHDYQSAVKAFQIDIGAEQTGILTVWQIAQLKKRSEMQNNPQIIFPQDFYSFYYDDYAVVKGAMQILDDRIAGPVNHVEVTCRRNSGTCEVNQLVLDLPDEDSWGYSYHVMKLPSEVYEVARWQPNIVETHSLGSSEECRTTSMNLNFKTKEFFLITRNAGGDCNIANGIKLEALKKPRVAQILDGEKLISEEFAAIRRASYGVLSSEFRKTVERLGQEKKD